ncbi:dihydrofolate reductase [Dyadobacter psychrotolerans]|uniref:Dihydrofolate reductase n=1 Tax=Dyadobacter psychrotolerans TaxID=2541721 RepID=A0A4R5DMM5_9BACT|nr:dihydrofolate reductase [Dyadobacter psychrotolerans]
MDNQPKLYLIAAMSENHVIGKENHLPWHLPDEWKHFKKVTNGKPFLMGRKSYDAPDALHSTYRNVILTEHPETYPNPETQFATDLHTAMALLREENEVFVLGGASVFVQTLPLAEKLFLTIVHAEVEGDAYFPEFDLKDWDLISSEFHGIDEDHKHAFSMNLYVRKKPEI